jgi:hypothetical protein
VPLARSGTTTAAKRTTKYFRNRGRRTRALEAGSLSSFIRSLRLCARSCVQNCHAQLVRRLRIRSKLKMCRQFESKIARFRWRGSLISSDDQPGDLGHPQHTLLPPVCFRAADRSGSRDRPHRAVKPISRSQGNDGYRADSGPSGGGPCKGAIRPIETSTAANRYVC